jgi:hypothetical protein
MSPSFVQQSSKENESEVVATDIGNGGIDTTSTRRPSKPVMHIFVPQSMSDGLSNMSQPTTALMTRKNKTSSPLRPYSHGSPTTCVALSMAVLWQKASPTFKVCIFVGISTSNSNGVVRDAGPMAVAG